MSKKNKSAILIFIFLVQLLFICCFRLVTSESITFAASLNPSFRIPKDNAVALPDVFTFYYPWYGTPEVSGYWRHWADENHNPDIIVNGRRQIASTSRWLPFLYSTEK